jgi:hypothetical protein
MKENVIANSARGEVHKASQRLVEVLNKRKEIGLELLKEEAGMESDILSWAIGWLIRDDAIEVIPKEAPTACAGRNRIRVKPILI